jgi:hypothetical protein
LDRSPEESNATQTDKDTGNLQSESERQLKIDADEEELAWVRALLYRPWIQAGSVLSCMLQCGLRTNNQWVRM